MEREECIICQAMAQDSPEYLINCPYHTIQCRAKFHQDCLNDFINSELPNKCPNCRRDYVAINSESESNIVIKFNRYRDKFVHWISCILGILFIWNLALMIVEIQQNDRYTQFKKDELNEYAKKHNIKDPCDNIYPTPKICDYIPMVQFFSIMCLLIFSYEACIFFCAKNKITLLEFTKRIDFYSFLICFRVINWLAVFTTHIFIYYNPADIPLPFYMKGNSNRGQILFMIALYTLPLACIVGAIVSGFIICYYYQNYYYDNNIQSSLLASYVWTIHPHSKYEEIAINVESRPKD